MRIKFILNKQEISFEGNPAERLLFFIRAQKLIETKIGCNKGSCGCCTVLMNKVPTLSCKISLAQADSTEIMTLEYFKKTSEYQDINKGFSQAGVTMCGFCDAGKIFTANRIIELNPRPFKEEIREKISHFDCTCTDIESLVNGIFYAAACRRARLEKKQKRK